MFTLTVWSYRQGFADTTRCQNSSRSARLPAMGADTICTPSRPSIEDTAPHVGNLPTLPLRLQIPQKWAGILTLPARSEPISILVPPHAKRAAPPPVEAPAECASLYGLVVRPKTSDMVSSPSKPAGTVVLTCTRAPASWSNRTMADEVATG
jgi:hypothetical protein